MPNHVMLILFTYDAHSHSCTPIDCVLDTTHRDAVLPADRSPHPIPGTDLEANMP